MSLSWWKQSVGYAVILSAVSLSIGLSSLNMPVSADGASDDSKKTSESSDGRLAAVVPVSRTDAGWMDKHDKLVQLVHDSHADIAFFGDSITEGMNVELMHEIIGPNASKFGIGGDRTQHLLWRFQNGELDFPKPGPKAFVVLIGTNNISKWPGNPSSSNSEILQGVDADLKEIRAKFPKAKILLLAMLPREEKPGTPIRVRVNETNELLKGLADKKHIWYADISAQLLEPDGKLSPKVMSDFLHPTQQDGNEKMFNAIKPHLDEMMAKKK